MASKMANYLAHFQRHHTAAEYDALVAGDVKIQAWLKKQNGLSSAERRLDEVTRDLLKNCIGPGLVKAADFLAGEEKSAAPSASGTLKQSIGAGKLRLNPSSFCGWIGTGPRRGYGRAVQIQVTAKAKIKLKRLSKKQSLLIAPSKRKNPTDYAYFLTHGHKAVVPRGKKALLIAATGFVGLRARAAAQPAKDFMAPALAQAGHAQQIAADEINRNLQTMLPD